MSDNDRPFGPGSPRGAAAPADADEVRVVVRSDPARAGRPYTWGVIRSNLLQILATRIIQPIIGGALRILESASHLEWGDGTRKAVLTILNNVPTTYDKAAIYVESRQDSNAGTIKLSGICSVAYTQPDNGGDTSAFLGVSHGGGPAGAFYRNCNARPLGSADYSDGIAPTLEVGTNAGSYAILAIAAVGVFAGPIKRSTAILARVDGATSEGIGIQPNDGVFDDRFALYVGGHQINAAPVQVKASVRMSGAASFKDVTVRDTRFLGFLQIAAPPTTTELPNFGDYGFFYDSVGLKHYIAYNLQGIIKTAELT